MLIAILQADLEMVLQLGDQREKSDGVETQSLRKRRLLGKGAFKLEVGFSDGLDAV